MEALGTQEVEPEEDAAVMASSPTPRFDAAADSSNVSSNGYRNKSLSPRLPLETRSTATGSMGFRVFSPIMKFTSVFAEPASA